MRSALLTASEVSTESLRPTARGRFGAIRAAAESVRFEPLEPRTMMSGEPEPPEPITADGYEPNNTYATASNLGSGSNTDIGGLTLHRVTVNQIDLDYFKFTAPSNGVLVAQINFIHLQGDLRLNAYDANQQFITGSNSSTPGNGREAVAFSVQAGQTYYIRVSGDTSPDYSLTTRALSAAFDWNMPKRTGGQLDQFGLPVYPNTPAYARPNPVIINGVEVPRYPVKLQSLQGQANDGVVYQWQISNSQYTTSATGALATVDLPQGQFTVTLTATPASGGQSATSTQTITVKDVLIVGIGDSYGSGEGNPHSPQQYDWLGFTTRGAIWASSTDGMESIYHRRAHRSGYAAVAQSALQLENSDPKSSVTFVFLDHTGATIDVGVLGAQPSGDPGAPGDTPAQVQRLAQIVGSRKIDSLVMSIGGNDMGFGPVLSRLVAADRDINLGGYWEELEDIFDDALANISNLGSVGYPALAAALSSFNIGQTFLMEYPDLTRDPNGTGHHAEKVLDDIAPFFEVDNYELTRAYNTILGTLFATMRQACSSFDWTFVSGIADAFKFHGYGDWLRKASESIVLQGPLGNRNVIGPWDAASTIGTMHPINGALDLQRDRINSMFSLPDLKASGFSVSADALLGGPNSNYTLTITNKSFKNGAPASLARIYMSDDSTVNRSDVEVITVAVPALGPGESITLTGLLPVTPDTFQTPENLVYLAPVVDYDDAVVENDEANNIVADPNLIARVKRERDLTTGPLAPGGTLKLIGTHVSTNSNTSAKLGIDEVVRGGDLDVFRFTVTAGQKLAFDIDAAGNLDTYIRLYRVGNDTILDSYRLAANDNAAAPGESSTLDSYMTYTFDQGGEYALVVGHAVNYNADPMWSHGRYPASEGTYNVVISPVQAVPPSVISSNFDVNANSVAFQFSKDVGGSINGTVLSLTNLTTGQTIPVSVVYDNATNIARFAFTGFSSGLPAGNYRATLLADKVSDADGNKLPADVTLNFFALPGDANRDRVVDVADLGILATNWQSTGRTFTQADFNYDGSVDVSDLGILASNWQVSTSAAPQPNTSPTASSGRSSLFSPRSVVLEELA